MKSFVRKSFYPLVTMFAASAPVQAAFLDFVIEPPHPGAAIGFDGSGPLSGTAIHVARTIGVDTLVNDAVAAQCIDCTLSFTSGGFIGYDATLNIWDFGPGGSISIHGGVDLTGDGDADDADDVPVGALLLSGSFNVARVVGLAAGNYQFQIAGGDFLDNKHPDLLDFYGLPATAGYQGNMNLSFLVDPGAIGANGSFSSTSIASGNIINQPVPIPAAFWLLGSGLFGVVAVARRRHPH